LHIAFRYFRGSAKVDTCIFMSHANGLCQDTWVPVIHELRSLTSSEPHSHIFTWDHRSHGQSDVDKEVPYHWATFGSDALAVVDYARELVGAQCRLVAVGHSMGGTSLMLAELQRPGTFTSMLLVEAVCQLAPVTFRNKLAENAKKRRDTFESLDAVRLSYKGKKMFAKWDPRCVEAYVVGGFAPTPNKTTVSLRCPPWAEAECFDRSYTGAKFGDLRIPHIAFLVAEADGTQQHRIGAGAVVAELARSNCIQTLQITAVPGATHFLPQEEPTLVARYIRSCVSLAAPPCSRL